MRKCLFPVLALLATLNRSAAQQAVVAPFEHDSWSVPLSLIDTHVLAAQKARGIEPAYPCSDEVFARRVYLDVIGTLPKPAELLDFFGDVRPGKRAALINALMERDEFADYWALKWCDLLRVKAEFPINLWPNAVQAYHRWIRDAVRENRPYDQFARDVLTSSGSNFRVPPVNFYRAMQGHKPSTIADAVALTFMGVRLSNWPDAKRADMAAFFSRVGFKPTAEWKEEIVLLDPAPADPLEAVFPDGTAVRIPSNQDPRRVFAGWLITPQNPWFARSIVNRIWSWLLGRGIIHEPDDIRPDNPPVSSELLAYLAAELVRADYDLRHVYRVILNSRTYQQSPIPRSDHPEAEAVFACYRVRQLDAEVLIDALCWFSGGQGESYSSAIPEPFTYIPERARTIALADGSITSPFLEMFGRPPRDTGLETERNRRPTDAQRLHLINSSHIQRKIERSRRLKRLIRRSKGDSDALIRRIYLNILSRHPSQSEMDAVGKLFKGAGSHPTQGAVDLAWALVNSKEFLYRH